MILVFGGTTEGRKAVEVLEEGGSPYYYSTAHLTIIVRKRESKT